MVLFLFLPETVPQMTVSSFRKSPDARRTGTKISPMFSATRLSCHINSTTGSLIKYKLSVQGHFIWEIKIEFNNIIQLMNY